MKKIILAILFMALVFTFAVTCYATDADSIADDATDAIEKPVDEVSENESAINSVLRKIGDSTVWITILTNVLAVVGMLGFLRIKTNGLANLISRKATTEEIKDYITGTYDETRKEYERLIGEINGKLSAYQDTQDKLETILRLFIEYTNIPTTAKAQISQIGKTINEVSGNVTEVVDKLVDIINTSEEELREKATPTPTLDAILDEHNSNYIALE